MIEKDLEFHSAADNLPSMVFQFHLVCKTTRSCLLNSPNIITPNPGKCCSEHRGTWTKSEHAVLSHGFDPVPNNYLLELGVVEIVDDRKRGVNDMNPFWAEIEHGHAFVEDQLQF
jgi:hypothetical protein